MTWLILGLSILWASPAQAAPSQRSLAQSTPGAAPQLYLLPASGADVILETHLADLRLDGSLVAMEASYRLRNPTEGPVMLGLRLSPGGDLSLSGFEGLSLTADGQALPLQPSGDGGYTSQVAIPADGRVLLRLVYQVSLGNNALATVRYAPAVLNQWPGNISLRVQLLIGEGLPTDAWMEVAPDGWTYGMPANPTETSIKWLYDANIPDTAFVFRLIAPATWAQLQEAKGAAVDGAPPANFVRLGDLYRRLYREAPSDTLRNRFYAQAVAAYTAGLTKAAPGAAPQDQAALHVGLAHLYRDRVVEAGSVTNEQYARLVVDEVTAALALLPSDDAQRAELERWQVDGLRVLLNAYYAQQNWAGALAIIDQLAALPPGAVDPAFVAEERRAILVQQALQFMQQGNREAALAVAGNQIAADGL
ncbi:MAG TPA: hypothetical protein VNK95_11760, partial [Caldilineaceae bacterium]|nr:hypothetical protein [Caldilineaceae bacterium]